MILDANHHFWNLDEPLLARAGVISGLKTVLATSDWRAEALREAVAPMPAGSP